MTQAQATELQRATEIAREKGHKVFTATVNATGATCYTVRSHSDPNTFHILHIAGGRIICDCTHHHHGHICSHAAAVRLFLIAQRDALVAIEQAERTVYAPVIHTFSTTAFGGISQHCAMNMCSDCYLKNCGCSCHQPAETPASVAEQAMSEHDEAAVIYCEDCGRFKSHCDAMGHANPPAPWSRMGQAEAQPSLPEGWEINEEGTGWVARHNGAAILTASYRNVKRFTSWQAARHAIDNQMHAEQVRAKSAAKRENAILVSSSDKDFSIWK